MLKSSRKFVQAIRTHKNSSLGLVAVRRQKFLTHGGPGFQFGRKAGHMDLRNGRSAVMST